jgi:hypothetical protein
MMKSISIILILLIVGFSNVFGQASTDTIVMQKVFGGYQFYQGSKRMNISNLVKTMKPNEQAFQEMKAAQTTYIFGNIVAFAGGFMVGWPIGTSLGGGDPNWTLAAVGAGLIIITIPISQKFNKQARTAVNTYNKGVKTSSFWDNKNLRFGFTGNGLGFTMSY